MIKKIKQKLKNVFKKRESSLKNKRQNLVTDGDLLYLEYKDTIFRIPHEAIGIIKKRKSRLSKFFLGGLVLYSSPIAPFHYQKKIASLRWKNVKKFKIIALSDMIKKFAESDGFLFWDFHEQLLKKYQKNEGDEESQ